MSNTFDEQTQGMDVTKMFRDRVKGKTFLICGLKRGDLPATTADALAHSGAGTIICTGHSQPELQPVLDHINRKHKAVKMIFVTADQGSLASFREAAQTIKKLGVTIDGFVGFPEVMAVPWDLTVDGHESHFQRNYLCYFLMLNLLCDIMGPELGIVLVTSSLRKEAPAPSWEDLGFQNGKNYHCLDGYSQSMLAIILFIKCVVKKYSIAAFSAKPGNTKTNIQTYVSMEDIKTWLQRKKEAGEDIPVLLQQAPKSLGQGSATVLRGLLDPELEGKKTMRFQSGAFLDHCQTPQLPHLDFPMGEESAEALWRRSQELVESFIS
ncbi:Short-chain dehydrogenase/reductase SDR [Penicillium robsamsonii]|uniref:Short-chain dehydrogenase/reductase SDR n=1 Tax=Penicillium robsamsonii TaxID=1792511 RepID=UPI002549BF9B|nr:Short-chain dehydrogenase/reductase SDR [Penicillium robsamsonii]KAJ5816945.1 Short-chain dehydrogenase/reductase SDR [Penicillium robsamsonii]